VLLKKKIIINDLKTSYYISADINTSADWFLLVHGWGSSSIVFLEVGSKLEKFFNILIIDLPGFGETDSPNIPFSLTNYSEFIKSFLIKLKIKKIIYAGHSFGGAIGLKLAILDENFLQKLILINSSGIRKKNLRKVVFMFFSKILSPIFKKFKFLSPIRKKIYKIIFTPYY